MPTARAGPSTTFLGVGINQLTNAGTLIECDPSIKAILLKIDKENNHEFIIEDIDDEHMLIKSAKLDELKRLLKDALRDTVKEPDNESSDED